MGYTTEFEGQFYLDKKLTDEDAEFLRKFSSTRRMKRNIEGYGAEGEFYVDGEGFHGQDREDTVIDYNHPPSTQPGLWCQWIPTDDDMGIEWDGGEKFYEYEEWIIYIIDNILAPRGYTLNGEVRWAGEDNSDLGMIVVTNNVVTTKTGYVTYI